jgi:hypothetical protein
MSRTTPGLLMALLVLGLGACAPGAQECSPASCSGCCNPDGVCVEGDALTACGSAGNQCNVCSGGQVCEARRCVFPPPVDAGVDAGVADAGTPLTAPLETWTWADFPASRCGNGAPTGLGVNRTTRSRDLLIYLQGGGACWNSLTCAFAATNISDGYGATKFAAEGTLQAAPFSRTAANNPFKDMSFVFVPYCTGDVHAGDAVRDYPAQAQIPARTVFHAGRANIEAFLPRLRDTFPDAERVFLGGSSAGAFGAQLNYERVAQAWPAAQVHVLADCGQIINPAGSLLTDWTTAWNVELPAECPGCSTDFALFPRYLHDKYPARRFALLAYTRDNTLRQFAGLDAVSFEMRTLALTSSAYVPTTNAKYFVLAGTSHVMLDELLTLQSPGGVGLVDWTSRFVQGDPSWASVNP